MKGHLTKPGLEIKNSVEYTISTTKIKGNLYLISSPTKCVFNVPDTKADQVLKGLSVDFDFYDTVKVSEIPGIALLENDKEKNLKEDSSGISFEGNWDKVQKIEDNLGTDTGSKPANIDSMPYVVVQAIDVKSEGSQNYKTESKNVKFSQPQIISQEKIMSFNNKDTTVKFTNITFIGENPSLELNIVGKTEKLSLIIF